MRRFAGVGLALLGPLLHSGHAKAFRTERVAADRPGNGVAATTVGARDLQFESGLNYALDGSAADRQHTLSVPTVMRIGLRHALEARVGSSVVGVAWGAERELEVTDTLLGMKLQMAAQRGALPDLALNLDVTLPSGRGLFGSDATAAELRLAAAWSPGLGLAILLNGGFDTPQDERGRYLRPVYILNVAYALPVLDGRVSVFAEYFGRDGEPGDRASWHQLDAGIAYALTDDLQLDSFFQQGLNSAATDLQLSFGLSLRR